MTRVALLLFGVLVLTGCANSSATECDATNAGSLFAADACIRGKGFDARIAQIRSQTRHEVEEAQLSRERAAALKAEAEALARDRKALQRQLATNQSQLDELRLQLGSARASNAEQQARLDTLREQLGEMERQLAAARAEPPREAAEIAKLEEDIERKRAAIALIVKQLQSS
ncbi:hypothetical protein SAMN06265365_12612 [Tistlia consotensis]|uniref:Lipoprotein n=1 Tax=Tistlia consotensis USBA 355 TaxID=560819 RepID=A0A1Y6CI82_9PROT|nr:hypothetical protein [Tistlia consotensis]SMF66119.1 hypothetical protein SAMN05428998_12678 [Tistlia consotensis USBA 355]SNS02677.1 hypothetical protein SAMN06265365_12612 [Tistlia consotensis]